MRHKLFFGLVQVVAQKVKRGLCVDNVIKRDVEFFVDQLNAS
jgi:hypothetical protein